MKKSSLRNSFGLLMCLAVPSFGATARVSFEGGTLKGFADSAHKPLAQAVYIADSEGCAARVASSTTLDIPENCKYLRGLYRYIFQPEGAERRQVLIGFAVHRGPNGARTFLVNDTVDISENAF